MFFENFLASVYPNVCSFCGKKINSDSYTCRNCLSILKYYKERIEKGNSNYSNIGFYLYNDANKACCTTLQKRLKTKKQKKKWRKQVIVSQLQDGQRKLRA